MKPRHDDVLGRPHADTWVWKLVDEPLPDGSRVVMRLMQGKDLDPGDRWRFYTGPTPPPHLGK